MAGESDDKRPDEGQGEQLVDERVRSAWRSWLSALATDAEAAMAAALAYESLPDEGRDAWLDALESDAPMLGVPSVALYAPLLAVESDDSRRDRIEAAIAAGVVEGAGAGLEARALRGVALDGTHACVIVAPLYLDFVQVLSCRYTPQGGFVTVRHDPLRHAGEVGPVREVDGVVVEPTPLRIVVEELAHAILADKRVQRVTPPALASFAHLFVPHLDDGEDAEPSGP
ncbi:MAG TPA: hypothetical protein VIF15_07255 [Polyangiaceae bacterium]|jgi:hypothetical protein